MSEILGVAPEVEEQPARGAVAALLCNNITVGAAVCIVLLVAMAAFAPVVAPYDPLAQSVLNANLQPSAEHWFGTDQFGRDVLSRVIFGSRSSLLLGVLSPLVAATSAVLSIDWLGD
jgi:peptide/nickel transport system permease protein